MGEKSINKPASDDSKITPNDVKFPSPIRARQGFTAVNPQSYDAGFWHSFCVQKKMIDPQNPSNN